MVRAVSARLAANATRIADALKAAALQEVEDGETEAVAMPETANDLRRAGVMTAAAHEKITLRHLGSLRGNGVR